MCNVPRVGCRVQGVQKPRGTSLTPPPPLPSRPGAAVYVALKRRDRDTIKNIAIAGGFKSKHMKMENIFALVEFGFDSFGSDVTGGKNVQQFIDDLYRDDPWTESAGNLVMAQVRRSCVLCPVSCVVYLMSCVLCPVSCVLCRIPYVL